MPTSHVFDNTNALLAPKLFPVNVKLLIAFPASSTNVAPDPKAIVPVSYTHLRAHET